MCIHLKISELYRHTPFDRDFNQKLLLQPGSKSDCLACEGPPGSSEELGSKAGSQLAWCHRVERSPLLT